METILEKNRKTIGNIYDEIKMDLYAIFRQSCISKENCEDLVQEVFMKLLGLDIILEDHLKALAITIAYQKRTDYHRRRTYINKVKNDCSWQIEKSYTNTDAEVNDILQVEMKVIRCMSELDKTTYKLSRFEEKSANEIAQTLNITKRAVESRLYRTRNMVRERVKKAINF